MQRPPYRHGLHELGDGLHVWLQPDGGWGWNNAGLVLGEERSLLVDTLFDVRLTRSMLEAMAPLTSSAPIGTVLNTHANGDHCWGNQLVAGAEIVASAATAAEMEDLPPAMLAGLVQADLGEPLTSYVRRAFGPFHFEEVTLTPPTRTFSGSLDLTIGGRVVELVEVGPAHTAGDVIAHVPDAATVFTGDILFIDGTPLVWTSVSGWIRACDTILALSPAFCVPGHGPVTGPDGVRAVRDYLTFVQREARARFEAGMGPGEAARDIDLGAFADWGESERIAINVDAAYRELDPEYGGADVITLFGRMADLAAGSH